MQNNNQNEDSTIQGSVTPSDQTNELPPAHSDKARGAFDLLGRRSDGGQNKKKLYLSIGAVVLVFLTILIAGWWWVIASMTSNSTDIDESAVKADATLDPVTSADTSMQQMKAEKLKQMQAEEERKAKEAEAIRLAQEDANRAAQGQQSAQPGANTVSGSSTPGDPNVMPQSPIQRKLAGGVVLTPKVHEASDYAASVSGTSGAAGIQPVAGGNVSDLNQGDSGGGLTGFGGSSTRGSLSNLGGTSFAPGKAVLAPPPKYLLRRNTYTSCVLYTEIVTDQPSLIECKLTDPLYSADGSTLLANAGDSLFGEQSVEVKPGQVRVFTSWTELDTQSGVRARLASLGTGPMGASGTEAWIDNHYPERLGGPVMLSLFQDVLEAAKNSTQKSGNGYTVNNSEKNTESMANKVLENTIGVQPTAHILPGTVMNVIVARDIDFSSVFENR